MGKGSRLKSMRRTAEKCIKDDLHETCRAFFNSLCDLRFGWRFKFGIKIIFKSKVRK